jgi:hypothetical protein
MAGALKQGVPDAVALEGARDGVVGASVELHHQMPLRPEGIDLEAGDLDVEPGSRETLGGHELQEVPLEL